MTRSEVVRARNRVAAVFLLAGLSISTWMSRIPEVRDQLGLTPGQLGWVLIMVAVGSVVALPTAGLVVGRLGAGNTVAGGAVITGCGLVLAGLGGGLLGSVAVVSVGLVAIGYGSGTWDVAMNVEGAAVERRLGRSIMPRLHAGFSLGTVFGAGLGAAAAALHLPVVVHLAAVGVVAAGGAVVASRSFLPAAEPAPAGADRPAAVPVRARSALWRAWREPRTLLIGVLVMTFALSEGIAYDWLAVSMVDGLGSSPAIGAVGLAVFVTAMTGARALGTAVLDRLGRVTTLRLSALLVIAGVLVVVFGGSVPAVLAGAVAWGLGTALGFPVGMSAAADDPARAAIRVSVVASVAYTAFLAGPPLLGTIGDQVGVQLALLAAAVVIVVGAVAARATRPLPAEVEPHRRIGAQLPVS